jgi:RNA-directed DNA polymerase
VNTDAPWPTTDEARERVLEIQAKLHRWAGAAEVRRFDDLFNLVSDPAFLTVAWERVKRNRGARSAGVDGETAHEAERRAVEQRLPWTICVASSRRARSRRCRCENG